MNRSHFCLALVLAATICLPPLASHAEEVPILGSGSLWRKHYTYFPPRLSVAAAKQKEIETEPAARAAALAKYVASGFETPPPPKDWIQPDFNDQHWLNRVGVDLTHGDSRISAGSYLPYARCTDPFTKEIGLLSLRGKFLVKDPAKVKKLTLAVIYRGGFIAYLNGKEIARASLPKGPIEPTTSAEEYPLDAFLAPGKAGKRKPLHWYNNRQKEFMPKWELRERKFAPVEIKIDLLKKGLNVLALEIHRTDYPLECRNKKTGLCFNTLGLAELHLKADTPADNVVTPSGRQAGFQVWNAEVWDTVGTNSFGNSAEKLQPIRIPAARNGTFSGKVVVGNTAPIEGLKAECSALKSSGAELSADKIKIRFGTINPTRKGGNFSRENGIGGSRFDGLVNAPPAKIEVAVTTKVTGPRATVRKALGLPIQPVDGAIVPVWVFVNVPREAKAGLYKGALTISAKGIDPVTVPIELTVVDWTVTDLKDRVPVFIYQSPESLAQFYKVKMWSEEHWKLIEKSLALMGGIGNMGLIFPMTAESVHGNPESMVIWLKKDDGSYDYDFSIFDRYLDTALKHHSPEQLKVVAINVWGNEARRGKKGEPEPGAKVTVQDSAGKRSNMKLPEYGTPECEALWKPLLLAIKKRLDERKVGSKLTYGVGNDSSPSCRQVAMFNNILPNTPWFRESHYNRGSLRYDEKDKSKVVLVACNSIVWGGSIPDPKKKRLYGWKSNPKHLILNFNRPGTGCLHLHGFRVPWSFQMWMESTIACGRNGNGRVGGDYFNLGINLRKHWKGRRPNSEAIGGSRGTLFGTYPQSQVGQTGLGNSTTDLFAPGPDGPITTARFENARAGNQAAEARVFIEKAILAKTLPAELAKKCQVLLDERANALRMWALNHGKVPLGSAGWRESTLRLYQAAAEVQKATKK